MASDASIPPAPKQDRKIDLRVFLVVCLYSFLWVNFACFYYIILYYFIFLAPGVTMRVKPERRRCLISLVSQCH